LRTVTLQLKSAWSINDVLMPVLVCLLTALTLPAAAQGQSVLATLERELRAIAESVTPSVVTVRGIPRAPASDVSSDRSMSVGSGIITDSEGTIITTARVVADADDFWVELWDGRLLRAALVGTDRQVAVLQINANGLQPASLGDAASLGVGSIVSAIGNSYGFSGAMTWGIVNGFRPDGTIQLTMGISAGNSGGALVDSEGRVVGIVKAKISEPYYVDPLRLPGGENQVSLTIPGRRLELPTSSVSLAIPIGDAVRSLARIVNSGENAPAYVGVYVEDLTGWHVAHFKTQHGVLVTGVVDQTPASRYGMKLGDVITAIDRQDVPTVQRFRQLVAQAIPGQRLLFDVLRGGLPLKIVVQTGRADIPNVYQPTASLTAAPAGSASGRPRSTSDLPSNQPMASQHGLAVPPIPSSGLQDSLVMRDPRGRMEQMHETLDSIRREIDKVPDSPTTP